MNADARALTERLAAALAHELEAEPDMIVSVPADTYEEQREIVSKARAWNVANSRAYTEAHLGWGACRVVTPEGSRHVVTEVSDLFVAFRFPSSVGVDRLLAFADLMAPYAWPDRPTLHLEHVTKGHEA